MAVAISSSTLLYPASAAACLARSYKFESRPTLVSMESSSVDLGFLSPSIECSPRKSGDCSARNLAEPWYRTLRNAPDAKSAVGSAHNLKQAEPVSNAPDASNIRMQLRP